MLVINNIKKLENKTIGLWVVKGIDIDQQRTQYSLHNYIIRLHRSGKGAAIVIDREEGELGHNVSLCYSNYDNVISIYAAGKNELKNKDVFLSLMLGIIDAEYDKNK